VCVSKIVLGAFALKVGLASRHNLKVDKTDTFGNVVEKIGALIQAKDKHAANSKAIDNLRMIAAITPDANPLLVESLTQVIADITNDVDSKIISGFRASQNAVVASIASLTDATREAVTQKGHAVAADKTWLDCVDNEKSKRVAIEKAVIDRDAANAATVAPCQQQEESKTFTSDPMAANTLGFACDISASDECTVKQTAWEAMVDGIVTKLNADLGKAREAWTEAKNSCDAAVAHADLMEHARAGAVEAWKETRHACQVQHETRQLGLCHFGEALQNKCEKVDMYHSLIAEVDAINGGAHSEPDRAAEWKTTQVTKCMLQKVVDGVDLDASALDFCETTVDYAGSVGVFDRKQNDFATQTSETNFSCHEKTITFNGIIWHVPEGEPASSAYTSEPFHPQVSLAVGTQPFTWCGGAVPPPCIGKNCA